MTAPRTATPTWRLREELRRKADEHIEGRRNFERHFGRASTKPLKPVELDPAEALQLLDALDEAERLKEEYHEQWMIAAGNRPGAEEETNGEPE